MQNFFRGRLFFISFYLFSFLGLRPNPALLFLIAEKDPAGRTLQAVPCGRPLQKASTRAFTLGVAPQTRPSFSHCRKRRQKG